MAEAQECGRGARVPTPQVEGGTVEPMAAIKVANPGAEVTRSQAALAVNICAARGLQDVLRPSLGPKGALKM